MQAMWLSQIFGAAGWLSIAFAKVPALPLATSEFFFAFDDSINRLNNINRIFHLCAYHMDKFIQILVL